MSPLCLPLTNLNVSVEIHILTTHESYMHGLELTFMILAGKLQVCFLKQKKSTLVGCIDFKLGVIVVK